MPALVAEDVQTWGKTRVEKEMRDRLEDVASIRQKNDGSLTNVVGDEADQVRQHNSDLGLLGERKDAILELERADDNAEALLKDLDEPSRKMRHAGGGGADGEKKVDLRDAGTIFNESDALKQYRDDRRKGIEAELPIGALLPQFRALDVKEYMSPRTKAVLGEDASLVDVGTQYPPESVRVGVLVEELFQQPNIADLMPQSTINQAAVPYMREDVVSQGAAETAEGALAPEASIAFTEDSAPVRKIPVILPVTEEILDDEALVRGHVNNRLPQFISMREDSQLLNGDGTGQNLLGVLKLSGIDASTSYSIGTPVLTKGQDILDSVFHASMRVAESFLQPDAAVTGLAVWETIRLAKDKNNQYLIAPATEGAAPRIWGLRVVTNQNMPAESAGNTPIVVGAFAQASQVWRRRAITLQVSDSHNDNFGRGILVVKATSRLAATHYRPAGYAVVTSAT
jgi:HK97 family phage major capsid protein